MAGAYCNGVCRPRSFTRSVLATGTRKWRGAGGRWLVEFPALPLDIESAEYAAEVLGTPVRFMSSHGDWMAYQQAAEPTAHGAVFN